MTGTVKSSPSESSPPESSQSEFSHPLSSPPVSSQPDRSRPVALDVFEQLTRAILATEQTNLSLLKVEMEGLSVLFGGSTAGRTSEAIQDAEAKTEEGFDNMPV
jgi:hypothetical protein